MQVFSCTGRRKVARTFFLLCALVGFLVLMRGVLGHNIFLQMVLEPTFFSRPETKGNLSVDVDFEFRHAFQNSTRSKEMRERWNRFYGEATCKDNAMRAVFKQLFQFWIQFAKQHQIRYALMWGTLMGIVRVNDLLPWDHDIDIIVDYRDILRLRRIAEKRGTFRIDDGKIHISVVPEAASQHNLTMKKRTRRSCNGEIVTKVVDPCSFQEPLSRVLLNWWFLDVYHYYDEGEQLVSIPEGKRFVINQTDMFPLRNCTLMGLVGLCPQNPLRLLENWYGEGCLDKSEFRCKDGSWQDVNGKPPKRDWRL